MVGPFDTGVETCDKRLCRTLWTVRGDSVFKIGSLFGKDQNLQSDRIGKDSLCEVNLAHLVPVDPNQLVLPSFLLSPFFRLGESFFSGECAALSIPDGQEREEPGLLEVNIKYTNT